MFGCVEHKDQSSERITRMASSLEWQAFFSPGSFFSALAAFFSSGSIFSALAALLSSGSFVQLWQLCSALAAFFTSGSMKSAAAKFVLVAQIETFASNIGATSQQLVCHKNCHFCVTSKCLCHTTTCHNITHVCHTMWGVHDDPPSSSLHMLPKFEDLGKQRSVYASGVGGGGEGGHT